MIKKLIASAGVAALMLGQSVAATAAPVDRIGGPVNASERMGGEGGISNVVLILVFAAIGAGIIFLIEDNEDQDLPTSP